MNEKENLENGIAIKTEEDIEKVKEEIKQEVIAESTPKEKQNKLLEQILAEAAMPVTMNDDDFKLGESELDIRNLSKKNKEQMMFRQGVLNAVYLKQCLTSLIDVTRLLMVIADKLGVDDIVASTDEVIEKVTLKNKELREGIAAIKQGNKA